MERPSKPSVESATDSEHRVFFWARLKLTGIYVLIVAVILLGFSIFLYQAVRLNLSNSSDGEFVDEQSQTFFSQRTLAAIRNDFVVVDILILAAAGGISYVLAGYTLRPIQRSLEAQRVFSENASHELRTPLAVMKNDIEVLRRNPSPSKDLVRATLDSNLEEIDRMSSMAEDLLALARSQNHAVPMSEKVDITETAREIVEKMRPTAAKKNISISMSAGAALFVQGNAPRLERVLINLLQNAIEHTPAAGSVTITITLENDRATLVVADTGSGIDAKDLPHVFERFYKGEGVQGNGLGLSIVRELIDQHDGEVTIESTKGKGTIVTVQLPSAV